jgi:ribosomal protein S18 acetylase RimI-like enzyme
MDPDEIDRIRELDRTEEIRIGYRMTRGKLQRMQVVWDSPNWDTEGDHEHSFVHQIEFCRGHLDAGGMMIGAFYEDRLVGIGVLRYQVRPGMAQLAFLHVSNGYRRRGIASRLTQEMVAAAQDHGALRMYVSAVPSGSAVGFYHSQGFEVTPKPLGELFDLEPEDIHMVMELPVSDR